MFMFWINPELATFKPDLASKMWDISEFTYWFYFWDIILLIMSLFILLSCFWFFWNFEVWQSRKYNEEEDKVKTKYSIRRKK